MHPANLAGAGRARQGGGQGSVSGGQALERGLHGGQLLEAVHAVGAAAQLARSLRAAEKKEAKDGGLVPAQVEYGADAVLVTRGASGVAGRHGEFEVLQCVKCGADFVLRQVHHRIAAGTLVRRGDQRVDRQRIKIRCGHLLFHQGAEHAKAGSIELHESNLLQRKTQVSVRDLGFRVRS